MEFVASILLVVVSLTIGGFFGSWGFHKVVNKVSALSDYRARAVEMEAGPNARSIYAPRISTSDRAMPSRSEKADRAV